MKVFNPILVVLLTTVFYACSSEDIDSYSLEDTTWATTKEQNGIIYAEWNMTFDKSEYCLICHSDKNGTQITSVNTGSYILDGNNISITVVVLSIDGHGIESTIQGTINGKTMYFPKTEEFEELTLHKK